MMLVHVFMAVLLVAGTTTACNIVTIRREFSQFSTCGDGMALKLENRFKETPAQSVLHCALLCSSDVACKSFDYDPALSSCHLGSVDVGVNCTEYMVTQSGSGVRHYAQGHLCKGGKGLLMDSKCQCPPAFNGPQCHHRMQDCTDWYNYTACDGVQWVWPLTASAPFQVNCDKMTQKARTVLMKRRGGSVSFVRGWEEYSGGFGDLAQDHWLGLRYMHLFTSNRRYQLKFSIKLGNVSDTIAYVVHSYVHVGNESSGYPLTATPMKANNNSGTLVDCLFPDLLHVPFSASLVDNDLDDSKNCSEMFGGGWWFNGTANCSLCNPTGRLGLSADGEHSGTGASDEAFWSSSVGGEVLAPQNILMFLLPEY